MADFKNVQPLEDFNWEEFENGGATEVSISQTEARNIASNEASLQSR